MEDLYRHWSYKKLVDEADEKERRMTAGFQLFGVSFGREAALRRFARTSPGLTKTEAIERLRRLRLRRG